MNSIKRPHLSLLVFLTIISCQESAPRSKMRSIDNTRESDAIRGATNQGTEKKSGSIQSKDQTSSTGTGTPGSSNEGPAANNIASDNNDENPNQTSSQQNQTAALASLGTDLRWMSIGEKPDSTLSAVGVCPAEEHVNRAVCNAKNTLCKSSGTVVCSDPSQCRRVFKCTTGIGAGNIWFAVGDVYQKGAFPSCPVNEHIAGASCTTLDDRCLSSFEITPGLHRLFKCLPSGGPGLLFLRWAWDAPQSEVSNINECQVAEPLQGKSCTLANDRCISKGCVGPGSPPNCVKRRLLKCTP